MNISLIALNAFRNAEGLAPFAEWRKARHETMLERYEDEYELVIMDLFADLADDNPDEVNDLGNNPAMQEQMDEVAAQHDALADEQADAAIDENNETPDSMLVADDGSEILESDLVAQQEDKAKADAVAQIATQSKLPSYKQMVRDHGGYSKIENPVEFIRGFLDANPAMTRKQAVAALVAVHGVNYSTARTQYQKWYTKHK